MATSVLTGAAPVTATASAPLPRRSTAREWWRAAAIAVIWLTNLFVVALWVAGGGVQALLTPSPETLTSLGRITGLVAANLLLLQVLLMARIPVFERGLGRDALTRLHRLTGFWSFWLMFAHIGLLIAGYAASAGIDPVTQTVELVLDYPGMLLATVGTLLLVMVVVTSIRRARRRLRYESWHLLHLYAYLGVGLAVPHMLWTGGDFLDSWPATIYWWSLWALAFAAVIVYRVLVPMARSMRYRLRVVEVAPDGSKGVRVRVAGRGLDRLHTRAGQFFVWRFRDGPGWTRGHPYSLAAAPRGDELTISARIVGDGTARLPHMRPGTRAYIEGPYGELTGDLRTARTVLMIGAGAGVAPLVSILEAESFAPGRAVLLTREHAAEDLPCWPAISRMTTRRGLRHAHLVGPRRRGGSSWLPVDFSAWKGADLVRSFVDPADVDVFVCGPPAWMDLVLADLRDAGVPASRIHTESFAI